MLLTIQILGIIFGIGMLYLTYIYLRRREFSIVDAGFWVTVWLGFVLLLIFSGSVEIFLETLHISRAMDFFMMMGFVVMTMVVFNLYVTSRRLSKKIELLVRKIAISKAENEGK